MGGEGKSKKKKPTDRPTAPTLGCHGASIGEVSYNSSHRLSLGRLAFFTSTMTRQAVSHTKKQTRIHICPQQFYEWCLLPWPRRDLAFLFEFHLLSLVFLDRCTGQGMAGLFAVCLPGCLFAWSFACLAVCLHGCLLA